MIQSSISMPSWTFTGAAMTRLPVRVSCWLLPLLQSRIGVGASVATVKGHAVGMETELVTMVLAVISAEVLDWRTQLAAGMPLSCVAEVAPAEGASQLVPSHQTNCSTPGWRVQVAPEPP